MIPDEAIKAAAKTAYVSRNDEPGFDAALAWDDMAGAEDWERGQWEIDIAAALEAAAPYMLSDYLLTLAADVRARGDIGKDGGLESWDYLAWQAEKLRPAP